MASLVAPQDQSTVRYNNTKMILDIIRHTPGVSRSSIARITGMSPTSATRIVGDLQQLQLVKETTAISGGVGRKAVSLEINPGLFCCLGIDISETKLAICLQCFG